MNSRSPSIHSLILTTIVQLPMPILRWPRTQRLPRRYSSLSESRMGIDGFHRPRHQPTSPSTVTVLSNPEDGPLKKVLTTGLKLDERRIRCLINNGHGPKNGISIEFEDGSQVKLGMLYYRPPTRSRAANLIEQLSLKTKPNRDVETEPMMMQSSLVGCFVIGDAQEMMKNACIAAASGMFTCPHF
jgi:hypothetical protein